ncbi:MAG TPA: hypothetical protein VHD36_03315 [Pirellulales bacterium]|nr:hypothetical protein [Pirellulales bacterium]
MASEPVITEVDREQIRGYLGEMVRAGDDFGRFVEEQFDNLQALAARLQDREQELEAERAALKGQLAGLAQALDRLEAASVAAERWVAESREASPTAAADHAADFTKLLTEFEHARTRFSEELMAAQTEAQSHFASLAQAAAAELAQARSQMSAASEELARERQRLADVTEPLLLAAVAAAPRIAEAPQAIRTPTAGVPVESAAASPIAEVPSVPAQMTDAAAPAVSTAAPSEDESGGWWGELQQLRRGLSKAVQGQGDAAPRRAKSPATS